MKIKTEMPSFEIEDNDGKLVFSVVTVDPLKDNRIKIDYVRNGSSIYTDFKRKLTFSELVKAISLSRHYED